MPFHGPDLGVLKHTSSPLAASLMLLTGGRGDEYAAAHRISTPTVLL